VTKTWTGCFGKLPIFGDFLRHNAFSESVRALDMWFQEGLRSFQDEHGDRWGEEFARIRRFRFIYSPRRDGRGIAGVFVPSVDKAGRRFPFVIYSETTEAISSEVFPRLPLGLGAVMDRFEQLTASGWEGRKPSELYREIESIAELLDSPLLPERLESKLGERTIGQLWGDAIGDRGDRGDAGDEGKYVLLQNLLDLVRPSYSAKFALSIRSGGTSLECMFWLKLAAALNDGQPLPSFVAWSDDCDTGSGPATIRILFDDPKPQYFQPLLRPDLPSRKKCEMERDGLQSTDRIAKSRALLGPVLADDSQTLDSFISSFVQVARR
jgi:type VI secretion system protein ImpM